LRALNKTLSSLYQVV